MVTATRTSTEIFSCTGRLLVEDVEERPKQSVEVQATQLESHMIGLEDGTAPRYSVKRTARD